MTAIGNQPAFEQVKADITPLSAGAVIVVIGAACRFANHRFCEDLTFIHAGASHERASLIHELPLTTV